MAVKFLMFSVSETMRNISLDALLGVLNLTADEERKYIRNSQKGKQLFQQHTHAPWQQKQIPTLGGWKKRKHRSFFLDGACVIVSI